MADTPTKNVKRQVSREELESIIGQEVIYRYDWLGQDEYSTRVWNNEYHGILLGIEYLKEPVDDFEVASVKIRTEHGINNFGFEIKHLVNKHDLRRILMYDGKPVIEVQEKYPC